MRPGIRSSVLALAGIVLLLLPALLLPAEVLAGGRRGGFGHGIGSGGHHVLGSPLVARPGFTAFPTGPKSLARPGRGSDLFLSPSPGRHPLVPPSRFGRHGFEVPGRHGFGFPGQHRHWRTPVVLGAAPSVVAVVPSTTVVVPSYEAVPSYVAPAPPAVGYAPPPTPPSLETVIQYPHGRYELRGDGVTTAYVWVWIPNPPPPPPAPPEPPAPASPPPASAPAAPGPRPVIYQWTDDKGVTHFTNDPESVPERHRRDRERPPASDPPRS